jgi:hypothetical protein
MLVRRTVDDALGAFKRSLVSARWDLRRCPWETDPGSRGEPGSNIAFRRGK